MSRKIIAIILSIIMLFCFVACSKNTATVEVKPRFEVEYKQDISTFSTVYIIEDTETGINYLFVKSGYGGGLTVLE